MEIINMNKAKCVKCDFTGKIMAEKGQLSEWFSHVR
jgi:hypothetical protein